MGLALARYDASKHKPIRALSLDLKRPRIYKLEYYNKLTKKGGLGGNEAKTPQARGGLTKTVHPPTDGKSVLSYQRCPCSQGL